MNYERFFSFVLFGIILILHFIFFSVLIRTQKFLLFSPSASLSPLQVVLAFDEETDSSPGSDRSYLARDSLSSIRPSEPFLSEKTNKSRPDLSASSLSLEEKEISLSKQFSEIPPSDARPDQGESFFPFPDSSLNAEAPFLREGQSNFSGGEEYNSKEPMEGRGWSSSVLEVSLSQHILRQLEARKVYPLRARQRRLEGRILLRFTLLPTGNIRDLVIEAPQVDPILIQAAHRLLEQSLPFVLPSEIQDPVPIQLFIEYRLTE